MKRKDFINVHILPLDRWEQRPGSFFNLVIKSSCLQFLAASKSSWKYSCVLTIETAMKIQARDIKDRNLQKMLITIYDDITIYNN